MTDVTQWVTSLHVHRGRDRDVSTSRRQLASESERDELIGFLAANPEAGDVIPDTGGVRKVRFAARGKGKRGGVRVVYYLADEMRPLYALLIYGKNEQDDLTAEQKKTVRAFAQAIKTQRRRS